MNARSLTIYQKVAVVRHLSTTSGSNARETIRRFNAQFSDEPLIHLTVKRINKNFDSTETVHDQPRSGRPRTARS